ncbi:MAG: HepT-like ribonuclease domain-containing protein [Cellulosilyticaceae bacterium]
MKNFKAIIDKEITDKYPNIPWRQMYGLRNRIVHDYEGVNLRLVWEVMTLNLENLREKLLNINE